MLLVRNRRSERPDLASGTGLGEAGARMSQTSMRASRQVMRLGKSVLGLSTLAACWELVRWAGIVDARDLPGLDTVLQSWVVDRSEMLRATAETVGAWTLGLLIASGLGAGLGILLGVLPKLEELLRPFLEFLRPIPSVALIPIALLVLGIGAYTTLSLIVFASIWPVLFNTYTAVHSVDHRMLEIGRISGLSRLSRLGRIIVPASLPGVATGVRTASSIALVLAITVEMLTGSSGIGGYLNMARLNAQAASAWAATIWVGALGALGNAVVRTGERKLLHWSVEHREAGR